MLVDKKIASLYSNLSLMMLGIFVPASVVGYFKLASKYISLTSVLTKPIANLLMVQLPKSIVTGARIFKDNLEKVSLYTLLLTLPVVGGMLVVGAFLVRLLYGAQYEPVIPLIYYLAFWPILSSYVIGVGASIRVLGLMKQSISVNSLVILLGLPIVYWLVKSYDVYGAVVALTVWNNIAAYIMFCLTRRHLKEKIIQEQSV
jgi:PST family polysaccharide transporter